MIEIIYEDGDVLVCRKPAGTATQTRRLGQQDMEHLLKNYRAKKKEPPYIGIVHRLDQPVEGVMVFAKNQKSAAELSRQIRERTIGKHYYAVAVLPQTGKRTDTGAGTKIPESGTLTDYLLFDAKNNRTDVISLSGKEKKEQIKKTGAKKAVLDYRILEEKDTLALFDILLHTGRHHQIRVQMAHMGCPLLGDRKYGKTGSGSDVYGENGQKSSGETLALCSYRLEFQHPVTGKRMDFSICPKGESFRSFFIS